MDVWLFRWDWSLTLSPPVWATGEEAEGDHREELNRLHVLNLFAEGHRRVEGMERKCTPCPKMEHQVAGSGQEAFEADPWSLRWGGLGHRSGARDGRGEGSQVPPERACGSIMGEEESGVGWGPAPLLPVISLLRQPESTGCILTSRRILTTVWCTTSSTGIVWEL